jgi:pyruvate formate lyase activating enzyme
LDLGDIRLRVGGITDMSTIDWYGNVSLVVFFAGCDFKCPYCQNSGLIPLDSGREIDLSLVEERIRANERIIDAVVFTGGEPLVQPAVVETARMVKRLGYKLMLNTNGSVKGTLEALLKNRLIDRVALDVKAPLTAEDYGRVSGIPEMGAKFAEAVEYALDLSKRLGVELEARTTVAPTVSDDPAFVRSIAESLRGRCDVYYLQQFDNLGEVLDPRLKAMHPPSRETMMALAGVATSTGLGNVFIKTRSHGLERVG